ncbi:MAG TPA: hypothetical protein ENJ42_03800 [Hellea balneolensis]|uniref:MobA-like NTP transferase domain-containing protein n=1 Tax=Hellea balneolensis TaxID=287478 RepID=A0A7C5LS99_9PROT|nr:hypothetical protein [Hellea balneolensis]
MDRINVLILAGQREGVIDPLCREAGVEYKALLPILGTSMIDYVTKALDASQAAQPPYYVSGIDVKMLDGAFIQSPSGAGPANSVVQAFEAGLKPPFLVTTCDHPLLSPEMVDTFVSESQVSGQDFTLGLASKSVIAPAYPDVKRTYLKFKDVHVSGCNLFYIANDKGMEAIRFWQSAQNDRKHPLKLARRVGLGMLFRYLFGGLTLETAFNTASGKLNIQAKPVLLPFAEAAIDVDKPSDLELVTQILSARS